MTRKNVQDDTEERSGGHERVCRMTRWNVRDDTKNMAATAENGKNKVACYKNKMRVDFRKRIKV